MFDEFDYSLDKDKNASTQKKLKKLALILSVIFVLFLFFYIVLNAYKFITHKPSIEDISLIKAETNEIKVPSDSKEKIEVDNIEISVYDVLDKQEDEVEIKKVEKVETAKKDLLDRIDIKERQTKDNKAVVIKSENKATIKEEIKTEDTEIISYVRAQIVALQTKDGVINYWQDKKNKHKELLSDKSYFIEKADLNERGVFYRLQVGGFKNTEEVEDFCKKYVTLTSNNKMDCIVVEVKR